MNHSGTENTKQKMVREYSVPSASLWLNYPACLEQEGISYAAHLR